MSVVRWNLLVLRSRWKTFALSFLWMVFEMDDLAWAPEISLVEHNDPFQPVQALGAVADIPELLMSP
jgi:hypothetical protein